MNGCFGAGHFSRWKWDVLACDQESERGMELIDLVLVFNAESAAKVTSCDTTFPGAKHTLSV